MSVAMNERISWPARTAAWVSQNGDALLIGSAIAAGLVLVMLLLRSVGTGIKRRDPECRSWRSVVGHVLAKTSLPFMVIAAVATVASYVEPPHLIAHTFQVLFIIAFAMQAAVWARELALGAIGRVAGDEDENGISNAQAVIRVLVSVGVFALALIVILDNLNVNVTGLIAGLGVGGIAIGLAAQGIFSDLFAALSILFDKPFKRGDTIRYDDSVGTVERIGLKTTRLRAITGEQLVMANTKLLEREIHNLAAGHSRRATITFGLVYQTPPDLLAEVPDIAKAAVDARTGCTFVRCALVNLGASALEHELIYDSGSLDPTHNAEDRASIIMRLLREFSSRGIAFAYPTQTTFTAAPDGTMVMPYAEPAKR
jgi:small-conductance mechanosensitive channel